MYRTLLWMLIASTSLVIPIAEAAVTFQFNLPALPLEQSLRAVGHLTRTSVLFDPSIVAGRQAPELRGSFTASEAYGRLLSGTSLSSRFLDDSTVTIVRSPSSSTVPASSKVVAAEVSAAQVPQEAGSEPGNILQEVVISAARQRHESAQTTPVANTVLSGRTIEQAHATNLSQLAPLIPNMQMDRQMGTPDVASIYLRGFGVRTTDPANEPHVAMFVDGIYQPAALGSLLDTYDLAQVEVMAGPQGTLLGRNAPIGAIYITSQKPTGKWGVDVETDYERYQHIGIRGRLDFPIIAGILAGKLSVFSKKGGNWVTDLTTGQHLNGEDTQGGRLSLAFTPINAFRWDLVGFFNVQHHPLVAARNVDYLTTYIPGSYYNVTQKSVLGPNLPMADCVVFYRGNCPIYPYGTTGAELTHANRGENWQVSSTMSYRWTPLTLTAVTGYYKYWDDYFSDSDATPFPGLEPDPFKEDLEEETQELRLASNTGGGLDLSGKLDWIVGAYASNFRYTNNEAFKVLGALATSSERGKTESWAEFAHLIFHLTQRWSISTGMRYTTDLKEHNYTPNHFNAVYQDPTLRFTDSSFEGGSDYKLDSDRMIYFRFAEGYEAGGFIGLPSAPGLGGTYKPEKNKAWEAGIKSDWLDDRLRVNFSVFTNNLTNLQVAAIVPTQVAPFFSQQTVNSGKATVSGAELTALSAPTSALIIRFSAGFLRPRYNQYISSLCSNVQSVNADCKGIPFSFAPKWSGNLGMDYRFWTFSTGITATITSTYSYKTYTFVSDPPVPIVRQPGYGLLGATLRFADAADRYAAEIYGTNILDKKYIVEAGIAGGVVSGRTDGTPAIWGVRITAKLL